MLVPQEIARFENPFAGNINGHFAERVNNVLNPRSIPFFQFFDKAVKLFSHIFSAEARTK